MQTKLRHIPYWGSLALLIYMPFHVFLSQWLSTFTGGLEYWKGAKDAVTFLLLIAALALAAANSKKVPRIYWILLLTSSVYGLLHVLTYLLNKETSLTVAMLATAYNCRLLAYLLIGSTAVLLLRDKLDQNKLIRLAVTISTILAVFGILQYLLPKDILTYFGYAVERGVKPNFFINEDTAFPRVMSTIRDPNSFGAFLLVPILMLVQQFSTKRNKLIGGLLIIHLLALYLSFSRAAWGGLIISLSLLFYLSHRDKIVPVLRRFWPLLLVVVVLFSAGAYSMRDTRIFRSVVLRANDTNPESELDSDELHTHFIREGIEGVADKPLGHGPGTAGIVSIQNENGSFLTENYYVQIAHEVGVAGLLLLVSVWCLVAKKLYTKRTALGLVLVAAAVAYAVMAMVMHLWTNEALAAQWWLLAGFTVVSNRNSHNKSRKA